MTPESHEADIRFCIVSILPVWGDLLLSCVSHADGPYAMLAPVLSISYLAYHLPIPLLAIVLFIFNTPHCRRIAWVMMRVWLPLTAGFLIWAHFHFTAEESVERYLLGPLAIALIVLLLTGLYLMARIIRHRLLR